MCNLLLGNSVWVARILAAETHFAITPQFTPALAVLARIPGTPVGCVTAGLEIQQQFNYLSNTEHGLTPPLSR